MRKKIIPPFILLVSTLIMLLSSCATLPVHPPEDSLLAYAVLDDGQTLRRHAPVFVIENHEKAYNRIGGPKAYITYDGKERVVVSPDNPTVFAEKRTFKTDNGAYTNLIYRIHFEEIPGGLFPFHLGAGKNIGLIAIVTLNSLDEPVLYTTVHTCGCYLAFVPTSLLPESAYPDGWNTLRQNVYSESLPGLLRLTGEKAGKEKLMILISDGIHRVKDMWISTEHSPVKYKTIIPGFQPLGSLDALPLNGGATSFFESSGPRAGYVKGSQKIRERLFISWWAFDFRVGEDKRFGANTQDGPVFYTSLKPWAKTQSDLRDFPAFLAYWNWKF